MCSPAHAHTSPRSSPLMPLSPKVHTPIVYIAQREGCTGSDTYLAHAHVHAHAHDMHMSCVHVTCITCVHVTCMCTAWRWRHGCQAACVIVRSLSPQAARLIVQAYDQLPHGKAACSECWLGLGLGLGYDQLPHGKAACSEGSCPSSQPATTHAISASHPCDLSQPLLRSQPAPPATTHRSQKTPPIVGVHVT